MREGKLGEDAKSSAKKTGTTVSNMETVVFGSSSRKGSSNSGCYEDDGKDSSVCVTPCDPRMQLPKRPALNI